jgi:hypothetical protein
MRPKEAPLGCARLKFFQFPARDPFDIVGRDRNLEAPSPQSQSQLLLLYFGSLTLVERSRIPQQANTP